MKRMKIQPGDFRNWDQIDHWTKKVKLNLF